MDIRAQSEKPLSHQADPAAWNLLKAARERQATNGKFLPRTFVMNYFDAKTGVLKRSEAFTDGYQKAASVWLPATRRIVKAADGKMTTRILEFRAIKVTRADKQAAR